MFFLSVLILSIELIDRRSGIVLFTGWLACVQGTMRFEDCRGILEQSDTEPTVKCGGDGCSAAPGNLQSVQGSVKSQDYQGIFETIALLSNRKRPVFGLVKSREFQGILKSKGGERASESLVSVLSVLLTALGPGCRESLKSQDCHGILEQNVLLSA